MIVKRQPVVREGQGVGTDDCPMPPQKSYRRIAGTSTRPGCAYSEQARRVRYAVASSGDASGGADAPSPLLARLLGIDGATSVQGGP
jgi:hypothetical protein